MRNIVFIADSWGPSKGGINSFNYDLCRSLGKLSKDKFNIICIVLKATSDAEAEAKTFSVLLISLGISDSRYDERRDVDLILNILKKQLLECYQTWFIGHDIITGEIARTCQKLTADSLFGIFHHMDYASYENFKLDYEKEEFRMKDNLQVSLLKQASIIWGVGPKLLASAQDKSNSRLKVHMIVPGLQEIDPEGVKHSFSGITFGRLNLSIDRVKQFRLAIASFITAVEIKGEPLGNDAKLKLVGVEDLFALEELNNLTKNYSKGLISISPMTYTQNRADLFAELSASTVCMMLSSHEGFGLVAWEAIAAGVPVIISENTGVFELIRKQLLGAGIGKLKYIKVKGTYDALPNEHDIELVVDAILDCWKNKEDAKKNALELKKDLMNLGYTWEAAARQFIENIDYGLADGIATALPKKDSSKNQEIKVIVETDPDKLPTDRAKEIYASFHEFSVQTYLKRDLQSYRGIGFDLIWDNYSSLYSSIAEIRKNGNNFLIGEQDNLFDLIFESINASKSKTPVLVKGLAGCGKSTFLSLLYLKLHANYIAGRFDKMPIYINLHYYENKVYLASNSDFQIEAEKCFENDTKVLNDIYKVVTEKNILYIIDGADEYIEPKVNLFKSLQRTIGNSSAISSIVGLRRHTDKRLRHDAIDNYMSNKGPEMIVELNSIDASDPGFESFINAISKLQSSVLDKDAITISEYLKDKIAQFNIDKLDVSTSMILIHGLRDNFSYAGIKNMGNFYEKYFSVTTPIDLNKAGAIAYKRFNDPFLVTAEDKNCIEWGYILKHETFSDYFIARHVIMKLIQYSDKKGDIFNHLYPHGLNSFFKDVMNRVEADAIKACNNIILILSGLESLADLKPKTHLFYLLGRVNEGLVTKAKDILRRYKTIVKKKIEQQHKEFDSREELTPEEKKDLLLIRTIYISLICLKDRGVAEEYIKTLLRNKYFDNLNRGFHLEYYGDIKFDASNNNNLNHVDDLCDYSKTFNRLFPRIKVALKEGRSHPMFEIELYTLLSLAQKRQLNHRTDANEEKRTMMLTLMDDMIVKEFALSATLQNYVDFIRNKFGNSSLKLGHFARDLYNIKIEKRAGWVDRKVMIPESIADHMYGAFLLAYLYLPEKINGESAYNKQQIINMLLIHDIAEAYTGDIPTPRKTEQDRKKERRHMLHLSMLETYDGMANTSQLQRLYSDFSTSGSLNAAIARDIDKLDNLMQLFIYKEEGNLPVDNQEFNRFRLDLIRDIGTEQGKEIKSIILKLFEG